MSTNLKPKRTLHDLEFKKQAVQMLNTSGRPLAQVARELGLRLTPTNMDRVSGWAALLQRLGDPAHGLKPTLFIHPRCQRLLECLPCLQHDPDRPSDVLKPNINEDGAGGDDPADALRYLVATKPREISRRQIAGPVSPFPVSVFLP